MLRRWATNTTKRSPKKVGLPTFARRIQIPMAPWHLRARSPVIWTHVVIPSSQVVSRKPSSRPRNKETIFSAPRECDPRWERMFCVETNHKLLRKVICKYQYHKSILSGLSIFKFIRAISKRNLRTLSRRFMGFCSRLTMDPASN